MNINNLQESNGPYPAAMEVTIAKGKKYEI